jgi:hypothetical protein
MGVGMALSSLLTTIILHAIGGSVGFMVISLFYFKKFDYTSPLQTTIWFIVLVVFIDLCGVALLVEKSLAMVRGILGTWFPSA